MYLFESGAYKRYVGKFIITLLFFIYFGLATSIAKESVVLGLVQAFVMTTIALYLLNVDIGKIEVIGKTLVVITFILSILGFYVFLVYFFDPQQLNIDSFGIASSGTGSSDITAPSYFDYFSFTSGEGFVFFGHNLTRVKGYSNEPSSTLVHYLAPVVFAVLYSKSYKYRAMAIFILLFSLIAISSLMGILAIVLSLFVFFLFSFNCHKLKLFISLSFILFSVVLMTQADYVVELILMYGNLLNAETSYDLLARKGGSAMERLISYNQAISLIIANPFGFSSGNTGTGLWAQIALTGGVLLLSIYLFVSYRMIYMSSIIFNYLGSGYKKYAIALIVALWVVSLLITSYGWDRIPGVIILLLFYRIVSHEYNNYLGTRLYVNR